MPDLPGPDVDIPPEVVELGAKAIFRATGDAGYDGGAWADAQRDAALVLAAALPAIRRHIADEISRTVGITAGTWGGLRDPALVKADAMGIVRGDGYCVCDDGPMLDCGISTHRAAARVARGGTDHE